MLAAGVCGCISCATCTASCCCKGTKSSSQRTAKIFYFLMLGVSAVLAVCMNLWGDKLPSSSKFFHTTYIGCANDSLKACFGTQAVFRISLACVVFFALMLIGSLSPAFHLGMWGMKVVTWALLIIVSFVIPYDFRGFAEAARVFSFLFLVAQVIIFIDLAYVIHEWITDKAAQHNAKYADTHDEVGLCQNPWALLYLLLVIVLQLGSLATVIGLYAYSAASGRHCTDNEAFLSITLICGVALSVMSAAVSGKGTLTPSIVFGYCTWLCWSSITASPDRKCNPMFGEDNGWSVAAGIIVAALSLIYTSYSATSSFPGLVAGRSSGDDDDKQLSSRLITSSAEAKDGATDDAEAGRAATSASADADDADDDDEVPAAKNTYWLFHVIMILSSMYMSMVLTHWTTNPKIASTTIHPSNNTAMYVQISTQWIAILLFVWSLFAEKCCPNREFA